ncbi:MAG TPA: GrpB family protein [Defluviitaleaceae bacterium]|nr:GrpB family protein [Defluviitaleaceae bacterium]
MKKDLSEMSKEELWRLFPIILKEHNPQYKEWYESEKNSLLQLIKKEDIYRINHIGSTAVSGLMAKPTVDILLELNQCCDYFQLIKRLKENHWILMSEEYELGLWLVFNKGYTAEGFEEKVFHLHVRYLGDWNELYFRDYLIDHPEVSKAYGLLKMSLWKKYEFNRDAYTQAKSEFINSYTKKARLEYPRRYDVYS